jgi:hypothetical protein
MPRDFFYCEWAMTQTTPIPGVSHTYIVGSLGYPIVAWKTWPDTILSLAVSSLAYTLSSCPSHRPQANVIRFLERFQHRDRTKLASRILKTEKQRVAYLY